MTESKSKYSLIDINCESDYKKATWLQGRRCLLFWGVALHVANQNVRKYYIFLVSIFM